MKQAKSKQNAIETHNYVSSLNEIGRPDTYDETQLCVSASNTPSNKQLLIVGFQAQALLGFAQGGKTLSQVLELI